MSLRNAFADLATEDTLAARFGGSKNAYAGVISSSGDHAVITPASGKRIKVVWVAFVPNSDNDAANLVQIKFQNGSVFYTGYAMAHWEIFVGPTNSPVIVNTATVEPVAITIHYEEI